jgi:hypothetical protein
MRCDKNFMYFSKHSDWYTFEMGVGYVPTEKAPAKAVEAIKAYNEFKRWQEQMIQEWKKSKDFALGDPVIIRSNNLEGTVINIKETENGKIYVVEQDSKINPDDDYGDNWPVFYCTQDEIEKGEY